MARPATARTGENPMEAAFGLVRQKGSSATSVDDICAGAGRWSDVAEAFFETAPYHQPANPFGYLIGYIDFRRKMMEAAVGRSSLDDRRSYILFLLKAP